MWDVCQLIVSDFCAQLNLTSTENSQKLRVKMTKDVLTLCDAAQSLNIWMSVLRLHTVLKYYGAENTLKRCFLLRVYLRLCISLSVRYLRSVDVLQTNHRCLTLDRNAPGCAQILSFFSFCFSYVTFTIKNASGVSRQILQVPHKCANGKYSSQL